MSRRLRGRPTVAEVVLHYFYKTTGKTVGEARPTVMLSTSMIHQGVRMICVPGLEVDAPCSPPPHLPASRPLAIRRS
jgi:hypothetical protein